MKQLITLAAALLLSAAPVQAAGIGPVVQTLPGWKIHRGGDSFTDAVECTAVQANGHAQIANNGNIYINMRGRGGISMTRFRYNDSQPNDWQLHTSISSDILVITSGQWQSDKRVRVQIYTILKDTEDFDFNVTNAKAALAAVMACQH